MLKLDVFVDADKDKYQTMLYTVYSVEKEILHHMTYLLFPTVNETQQSMAAT